MGIFESVCQTMAYAHARGVIHRDLKPSNIMVGAFGEVQVMDWGLAKILTRQGPADEESDAAESEGMPERRPTGIAVAHHEFVGDRSRPGSVLGTPAYMAPEQARGEVELLDERSDVFALGSILCEVLTGRPAFTGANSDEIERRSARGDVAEAIGRLDACGADRKLAGLAAECLAAEPTGRPRDARELAERVTAHRIGVQEQLHAAELAKVHAQAQAAEEGRRRRLTIALAASVLALVVFGGGASTWLVYQRQTGLARVAVALKEIELLRNQAVDDPGDVSKWHAARAAMQHARDLMDTVPAGLGRSRLRELDDQIENGARAAEEDRTLVTRLEEIRVRLDADQRADAAYTEAFAAAGLDLSSPGLDPVDIGEHLATRPPAVARAAAAALDAWAIIRRSLAARRGADTGFAFQRLTAAARAADPDPWRNRLRDVLERGDQDAASRLAEDKDLDRQGPGDLWLLGVILELHGQGARALDVFRRGQRHHPGDFWLNHALGMALLGGERVRPQAGGVMVQAPPDGRDSSRQAAEVYLMAALAVRPQFAPAHHALATLYKDLGKWEQATYELETARRLQPDDATIHNTLGNVLMSRDRLDEAIAAYRRAIELDPRYNLPHLNLGDLFFTRQRKIDQAIREYREAIRISPSFDFPHVHLGYALENLGRIDEAIAEYRQAMRLNPRNYLPHANLGWTLGRRGDLNAAEEELRKAYELSTDPRSRDAIQQGLAHLRRRAALDARFDGVLRGVDHPRTAAERVEFAVIAQNRIKFTAAVRLYAEALEAEPGLAGDRSTQHRYNAACCAVLAASGQGQPEAALDDDARAALRRRALGWLQAELTLWSNIVRDGPPGDRSLARSSLQHWKSDPDLAAIHSREALAKLPESERKSWQDLWSRVDDLIRQAEPRRPAP